MYIAFLLMLYLAIDDEALLNLWTGLSLYIQISIINYLLYICGHFVNSGIMMPSRSSEDRIQHTIAVAAPTHRI